MTQRSVVVLEADRKSEHAIVYPFNAVSGAAKDVDKFEPVCHDFKRNDAFCMGAALKCKQKM